MRKNSEDDLTRFHKYFQKNKKDIYKKLKRYEKYVKRHEKICRMRAKGMTLVQIGLEYGLTRQRIQQILRKYDPLR